MKKIIIRDQTPIPPFNEPARDLRIMNKLLWLYQRDVLSPYCQEELECKSFQEISSLPAHILSGEIVVYRDNLFFDEFLFEAFITTARKSGKAAQIAFSKNDKAIVNHALLNLQSGIRLEGDVYVADLFYYPDGAEIAATKDLHPIVVDTQSTEIGYYRVPTYFGDDRGDLKYDIPLRAFLSIENWVHIYIANCLFGILARGARIEKSMDNFLMMLKVLWRSLLERKQFLSSSPLVLVGRNTQIDPNAVIEGPAIIGDNVIIYPGSVIDACIIGDNVTIMNGTQLFLSVVGDGSYLAFRAALFMTTLMENAMVAQNTCLQMSVVGRDTFIGAGNTFTDFNLMGKPLKVFHKGELREVGPGLPAIGGCVGHNCRIGSGHTFYPARSIESDVVLVAKQGRTIITKNVKYEDSDHHDDPESRHEPQYQDNVLPKERELDPMPQERLIESKTETQFAPK